MDRREVIITLSDGVAGATVALASVMKSCDSQLGRRVLSALCARGVKGSAIWLGYDRWAQQDARKFAQGVVRHDEGLWACMLPK
jgi:hypothetical protein